MSIRAVTSGRPVGRAQPLASNRTVTVGYPWARPSQWLALADVTGTQKFSGLYAIYPDGNLLALSAAGNYTVDWGDGNVENFSSGATAYHEYTYSGISSTNESTLGYRQVVVSVYPQSGQNLTTLNLQKRHNKSGLNTSHSVPWLDIAVNGSNLTSLSIGGSIPLSSLRQATIGSHAVTNMSSLFNSCYSLVSVPLFNTASVTNMNAMFGFCYSLQSVPQFNTGAVTDMALMFYGCYELQSVPLLNTAAVTTMSGMFQACPSLASVPLLNTASVTNMSNMFNGCSSLNQVPLLNTAVATNTSSMFRDCFSLSSAPLLNTAAATNMSSMFSGCYSLESVPLLNTGAATNTSSMFAFCSALRTPPAFNTAASTNMSSMFRDCSSLAVIPALNATAVTSGNFGSVFLNCNALSSCSMTNINQTISFANCKLSAAQIDAIFGNLSSSGTGKTITVTGNYGAASCTTSIATAKGWTVAT